MKHSNSFLFSKAAAFCIALLLVAPVGRPDKSWHAVELE
jgi:hypothetical protein